MKSYPKVVEMEESVLGQNLTHLYINLQGTVIALKELLDKCHRVVDKYVSTGEVSPIRDNSDILS